MCYNLTPVKVIGDTAYGDGLYRKDLKENGTEVVAPLRETNTRTKAIYPKSMFHYHEDTNLLTCPANITVKQSYYDWQKEIKIFHFPMTDCANARKKPNAPTQKDGRRTVGHKQVQQRTAGSGRVQLNRTV